MPTIKTGEWLKATLKQNNMTQKELANLAGLSIPAIAKIISGERKGSTETWNKIYDVISVPKVSIESQNFIDELREEIEIYGTSERCTVWYKVEDGNIVFIEYALDEDLKKSASDYKDLKRYNTLVITLKEALDLFKFQNRII